MACREPLTLTYESNFSQHSWNGKKSLLASFKNLAGVKVAGIRVEQVHAAVNFRCPQTFGHLAHDDGSGDLIQPLRLYKLIEDKERKSSVHLLMSELKGRCQISL